MASSTWRHRISRSLPPPVRRFAKSAYFRIGRITLGFASRSRLGTSIYYLATGSFQREMHAVAAGQLKSAEYGLKSTSTDFNLRRNVHRLEKGLVSRPRKSTFAASYIEETVDRLALKVTGSRSDAASDPEARWAYDVLQEYFEAVASNPIIDLARARFEDIEFGVAGGNETDTRLVPFHRDLSSPPPVTFEEFLDLTVRRHSVRWFEPRTVPRDLIDAAVTAAAQSPSACNRQPFEFLIYDEPTALRRVAAIPPGTTGFADNFPAIVVIVGQLDAFFSEWDRHVVYIDGSLAAMAFMLALETLGLSSCAINAPAIEATERQLAAAIGLETYQPAIMLIAVGYPDPTGMVPRSQKRPIDQLRRYNP